MLTSPWPIYIDKDDKPTLSGADGARLLVGAWDRISIEEAEKHGLSYRDGTLLEPRRGRKALEAVAAPKEGVDGQ